ncbi:DUF3613 domain-containing protein [Pseudomonas sp. LJDD11]|uniref:DUF3613 domain-containing protein n=1 Tax=unclassified Pseudomonas TaxID=196821 RepID=UPI0004F6871F|nr:MULTISPECIES: DUF3613 domain-containing protein [unclassified Pseudomonas]MCQ9425213.1 DUF3613 domain-containing protein [Pseudomonas sp. LJDD11]BAP41812.1 putative exported protein [Pseudomonas sp. StFLB209]
MKTLIGIVVLFGLHSMAWAIEPGPASQAQQQTETWLQLQVKGSAASKIPQTATPTEREQSLQRWLDSNNHKIPEFFDQEQGGKVAGGSR